jgi:hypothetical protein
MLMKKRFLNSPPSPLSWQVEDPAESGERGIKG